MPRRAINKSTLTVNPKDLKRLRGHLKVLKGFGVDSDRIMDSTAEDTRRHMQRTAKRMGAFDTGRLHDNIDYDKRGKNRYEFESIAIDPETRVEYAYIVHEGLGFGRNSGPRRYFSAGIKYFRYKFRKNVEELFRNYTSLGNKFKSIQLFRKRR